MLPITEILYEIRNLDDKSIDRWISKGLTSLTPEMLDQAIREWRDPIELAQHLHLEHPLVRVVAKSILKIYWERVEYTLTDQWELYNQIAADPEKKILLDTPRGRAWLSYVRERCYKYYFDYTWN